MYKQILAYVEYCFLHLTKAELERAFGSLLGMPLAAPVQLLRSTRADVGAARDSQRHGALCPWNCVP